MSADLIDDCGTPIQRPLPPTVEYLTESDPQPVSAMPEPLLSEGLFQRLIDFRAQLVEAWSLATIHPSYTFQPTAVGQCGVSSAWILWKLGRHYRSQAEARYCYGDIAVGATGEKFEYHCWIEIGAADSAQRMVIDVTCDQFKVFEDMPVLFERHDLLVERSIEYRADSRRSFRELREDHVWSRFEALRALTDPELATLAPATG